MKIRNGFVSNSSSSSFVVAYRRPDYSSPGFKYKKLLGVDKAKKLKKFGFKYTNCNNPYFVDTVICKEIVKMERIWDVSLTYHTECNQNDVIYFLLTENIPFIALCHYDEELIIWDGNSEWFFEMPNITELFSRQIGIDSFSSGKFDHFFLTNGYSTKVKKHKISDWLANERKLIGITQ